MLVKNFSFISALFYGAALTLSFAPFGIFPLAIFAPAGLLLLWLNCSPKRAFFLGYIFGLGFFGTGVYWVYNSIYLYGGLPLIPSILITMLLVAFLSLYPAASGYFLNKYFPGNHITKLLCAFPAIWVFSEWVRSWFLTGFAWLILGYSQTNSPLKGYAPVFGVYGISLALTFTAGLFVLALNAYKRKDYQEMYLGLFAFVLVWIGGSALTLPHWTKPTGKPVSMSLVQGNIPQSIKWSPDQLKVSLDTYRTLTEPLWGKSDIIVWPEAAVPLPLQYATDYINELDDKALKHHTHLILGIPMQASDGNGFYNTIVMLGKEKAVYAKRRLVPYGEYVPFSDRFAHLFDIMSIPMANTISGGDNQPPFVIGQLKLLPSICYEITYPELIYSDDSKLSMLLTVTNDAWFGDSPAQAQHLQMAAMRAIEFGRSVIFSTNDGITAILSPTGQIAASLPPHQAGVLTSSVQAMRGLTPLMRYGYDPLFALLISLLIVPIIARKSGIATSGEVVSE